MKSINWSKIVNETEFQELFELYWNTLEGSKERSFVITEINKYVYFYIINRYNGEFDLASDFFLENMTQTIKLIEDYEPSYHITFLAYVTSKIKRRYFNFKLKAQKTKSYENMNDFYEINPDADVKSVFESRSQYFRSMHPDVIENLHACLSTLKTVEEITIKLYFCFPLLNRDFRFLVRGNSRQFVFSKYRDYVAFMEQKLQGEQEVRGNIIRKLYFTNIKLRDEFSINILRKRKRLISALYEIKNPVPLRLIAELMQTNVTCVHRRLKRARNKLEEQLSKQFYFNFEETDLKDNLGKKTTRKSLHKAA